MSLEYTIYKRRTNFRKRRNLIRRIFLFFFVVSSTFLSFKIYSIFLQLPITIQVLNYSLSNVDYLTSEINSCLDKENIFLISTRKMRDTLISTNNLLNDVVIRKYIFPECKLIVYLDEKQIWGDFLIHNNKNNAKSYFITDSGDVISKTLVNVNLLKRQLTNISCSSLIVPEKDKLVLLKSMLDLLKNRLGLQVLQVLVLEDLDLELIISDLLHENLVVKVGKINTEIFQKISKMEEALRIIREKTYKVEYLDLTLEDSIVFKKQDQKRTRLFGKKRYTDYSD